MKKIFVALLVFAIFICRDAFAMTYAEFLYGIQQRRQAEAMGMTAEQAIQYANEQVQAAMAQQQAGTNGISVEVSDGNYGTTKVTQNSDGSLSTTNTGYEDGAYVYYKGVRYNYDSTSGTFIVPKSIEIPAEYTVGNRMGNGEFSNAYGELLGTDDTEDFLKTLNEATPEEAQAMIDENSGQVKWSPEDGWYIEVITYNPPDGEAIVSNNSTFVRENEANTLIDDADNINDKSYYGSKTSGWLAVTKKKVNPSYVPRINSCTHDKSTWEVCDRNHDTVKEGEDEEIRDERKLYCECLEKENLIPVGGSFSINGNFHNTLKGKRGTKKIINSCDNVLSRRCDVCEEILESRECGLPLINVVVGDEAFMPTVNADGTSINNTYPGNFIISAGYYEFNNIEDGEGNSTNEQGTLRFLPNVPYYSVNDEIKEGTVMGVMMDGSIIVETQDGRITFKNNSSN